MANNRSAEKRIRQTEKRTVANRARIGRIRTFVKKVESAVAAGDYEVAKTAFASAEPELRRGVTKGVLKMNTAARKISRLSAQVKALGNAQA